MKIRIILSISILLLVSSGCASASSWLSGWNYVTPVVIADSQSINNYQVKLTLQGTDPTAPGYVDFSKFSSDGSDLRVTESDGVTLLPYWIESWNYNNKIATIWIRVSSNASSAPPYFKFSTTSSAHNTYGLSYPVTYEFNIPSGSSNLKAYKKYSIGDSWTQISEKTSNDLFNGIEAVRFDYSNKKAYVSVAFDTNSNDIYLEIVDGNNKQVGTYNRIDKFYDNRVATVVASADDWATSYDSIFSAACDMFRSKQIWFTPGIITSSVSPATWANIQSKTNAGYMEPASHSRSHIDYTEKGYSAFNEVDGSKQDILSNLNMIQQDKKGSSQYFLYTYIEPFGHTSSDMRAQLGSSKYLVDRSTIRTEYYDFDHNAVNPAISTAIDFPTWDSTNGLYNRFGYSIRFGNDSEAIQDVTMLNKAFDIAYNQHGIYHLMCHPWAVDWTPGQYADQHLTHISGKKDVWYVGLGDMFLYNYIRDQKASQNIPISGITIYVYSGNSSASSLSNFNSVFVKDYSDSGCIGLWHMDEGTGVKVADSSGNRNNGTITGATWGATDGGQWGSRTDVAFSNGSYLQFSGINNFVDFGNSNSLNFGNGAFSIEMWVKISTQSQNNPGIIDKSDNSDWTAVDATHTGYLLINRDINGKGPTADDYVFMIGDGTTSASHIPDTVSLGPLTNIGWTHLVITVDAGTTAYPQIKVYKNGVFLTSINRLNLGNINTANNLIVGKWRNYGKYFSGSVDELREYNRVLSPDEVWSHYQRESSMAYEVGVNVVNASKQPMLPVANFSANITRGDAPLSVIFTDKSTNATEWKWDFGDKTSSIEKNVTHTFSTAGNYIVNLTVSNANGTDSATQEIIVSEAPTEEKVLPVANFSANITNGVTPLSVKFNDSSLNATSWQWDFGDNTSSIERNTTHTYSAAGNYTATLTASNVNGSDSKSSFISVTAVAASNNANLGNLTISTGVLSPSFAPGTIAYTDSVSYNASNITITPTVADSKATIAVNGVTATSGLASQPIDLKVGKNTINIVVTAQNGVTKTYTITVTRASASSNSNLGRLTISSGVLSPAFVSSITRYTDSVFNSVSNVTITPTAADSNAKIAVNGVTATSGLASQPINLKVGKNTISIVVTAQNGVKKTYTITVTRSR